MKNVIDYYKKIYYVMKRIRLVEEEISKNYKHQKMRCPTHLSIGQELVGGLISLFLKKNDFAISTHRAHAHYLGKGGDLKALISELYGKITGCSKGRGGSMHLIDKKVSFMGSTAIVGSNIPIGVGLALSIKFDKSNKISCIFLGDGSIEEGVFFESVNFTAVKPTPTLFICENNNYSVYTPIHLRQPSDRKIYEMVESLGVKSFLADSRDINDTIIKFKKAVKFVRENKQPVFFEISTYRWKEHCGPNEDEHLKYRSKKELSEWKKADPLKEIEKVLLKNHLLTNIQIKKITHKIKDEIAKAFDYAEKSEFPKFNSVNIDEYAN